MTVHHSAVGQITVTHVDTTVWHIGFAPEPWQWTPWEYATGGTFTGRWDDPDGRWRALYVGATPLACYLEVLAPLRPDPDMGIDLASIVDNDDTDRRYPTANAGTIGPGWRAARQLGSAHLRGTFTAPADMTTLATLRPLFIVDALHHGLADFDAAAIRLAHPRALTQQVAALIYGLGGPDGQPLDGIAFESRHGDGIQLWAVFERDMTGTTPAAISDTRHDSIDLDDAAFRHAAALHHLTIIG